MRLIDLHPKYIGTGGEGITDRDGNPVPWRDGVGIEFDCPCGCESPVFIPFENPLGGGTPVHDKNHCWKREGEDFETLTITPSIQRVGGCAWHGFVKKGEIVKA